MKKPSPKSGKESVVDESSAGEAKEQAEAAALALKRATGKKKGAPTENPATDDSLLLSPKGALAESPSKSPGRRIARMRAYLSQHKREGLPAHLCELLQQLPELSDDQVGTVYTTVKAAFEERKKLRCTLRAFFDDASTLDFLQYAQDTFNISAPDHLPPNDIPTSQLREIVEALALKAELLQQPCVMKGLNADDDEGGEASDVEKGLQELLDADAGALPLPSAKNEDTPPHNKSKATALPLTEPKVVQHASTQDTAGLLKQSMRDTLDDHSDGGAKRRRGAAFVLENVDPYVKFVFTENKDAEWQKHNCAIRVSGLFIDAISAAAGAALRASLAIAEPLQVTLSRLRKSDVYQECVERFLHAIRVADQASSEADGLRPLLADADTNTRRMVATLSATFVAGVLQEDGHLKFADHAGACAAIAGFLVAPTATTRNPTLEVLADHAAKMKPIPFHFHGLTVDYGGPRNDDAASVSSAGDSDSVQSEARPTPAKKDDKLRCSKCGVKGHRRSVCPEKDRDPPKRPLDDFHVAAAKQRDYKQPRGKR